MRTFGFVILAGITFITLSEGNVLPIMSINKRQDQASQNSLSFTLFPKQQSITLPLPVVSPPNSQLSNSRGLPPPFNPQQVSAPLPSQPKVHLPSRQQTPSIQHISPGLIQAPLHAVSSQPAIPSPMIPQQTNSIPSLPVPFNQPSLTPNFKSFSPLPGQQAQSTFLQPQLLPAPSLPLHPAQPSSLSLATSGLPIFLTPLPNLSLQPLPAFVTPSNVLLPQSPPLQPSSVPFPLLPALPPPPRPNAFALPLVNPPFQQAPELPPSPPPANLPLPPIAPAFLPAILPAPVQFPPAPQSPIASPPVLSPPPSEDSEVSEFDNLIKQARFSCNDKVTGFYANVDLGCQIWHYCFQNHRYDHMCSPGTLFSQEVLTCTWAKEVNCANSAQLYDRNNNLFLPPEPGIISNTI